MPSRVSSDCARPVRLKSAKLREEAEFISESLHRRSVTAMGVLSQSGDLCPGLFALRSSDLPTCLDGWVSFAGFQELGHEP